MTGRFSQILKDICLMQGQGDLYNSIKTRMEESRIAHEKELVRIRARRREIKKYISWATKGALCWVFCMGIVWLIIAIWES